MPDRADLLNESIDAILAGAATAVTSEPELTAIAGGLRFMPEEHVKERVRAAFMLPKARKGYHTVTPLLIHHRAPELVEFLKRTFDAEEVSRKAAHPGEFSVEMRIGDSMLGVVGGDAAYYGNRTGGLHVFVKDCDETYRRAIEAGATTRAGDIGKPAERPYGERTAYVEDAFGNHWYIGTPLPSNPRRPNATIVPGAYSINTREYIGFLERAFGARLEHAPVVHGGRIMYASVRIGDSVVELGDVEDESDIRTSGFFMYVDDVDKANQRALDAGAVTVRPMSDEPPGHRSALVQDPSGYLWWAARLL